MEKEINIKELKEESKIKVYAPNGKELKIYSKTLIECPLCHKLSLIDKCNEDEEGVDMFCANCQLEFTSFPLRKFIKIRGFLNDE